MNEEIFLDWLFMFLLSAMIWFLGYLGQRHVSRDVAALERAYKQAIEAHDSQKIAQIERLRRAVGDIIRIPSWMVVFFKLKIDDNLVNTRSLIIQLIGLGLALSSTFLALFEPDHEERVAYLGLSFALLLFISIVLEVILSLSRRR
ncbi:hypothetical protein [Thermogutta sp.]|uniref:hypothetical protein n=1 Tax=Thermogutta sp. TaxID=1962930 RepID=UPI00321FAE46